MLLDCDDSIAEGLDRVCPYSNCIKNILIKEYDDTLVVKLSDFGLVKIPDSTLTTVNTEFKGYFNDPALVV